MNKKNVLASVVGASFVISILFEKIFLRYYEVNNLVGTEAYYNTYIPVNMLLTFFLSVVFFIVIIIFFKLDKLVLIYLITMILAIFGYSMFNIVVLENDFYSFIVRLFGGMSYFGSIAGFLLAFFIVLQESYKKMVTRSFLFFSLLTLYYNSYMTLYAKNYIRRVFGPFPEDLVRTWAIYDATYILLRIFGAFLQVMIIIYLVEREERFKTKTLK